MISAWGSLYGKNFVAYDEENMNLAWTWDASDLLDIDLNDMMKNLYLKEIEDDSRVLQHYAVSDPYGPTRLSFAANKCFNVGFPPLQVFCGAGVTGLLASLSALCTTGLLCLEAAHLDLPAWIIRKGLPAKHFVEQSKFFKKKKRE